MKKFWIIDLFRNELMKCGDHATADRILQQVFSEIKKEQNNPWTTVFSAIQATQPLVQVKTTRVGKSNMLIPKAVTEQQQPAIAIKWIVSEARSRKDKRTMAKKLLAELYDSGLYHRGGAVQRRVNLHQVAHKNLPNIRR